MLALTLARIASYLTDVRPFAAAWTGARTACKRYATLYLAERGCARFAGAADQLGEHTLRAFYLLSGHVPPLPPLLVPVRASVLAWEPPPADRAVLAEVARVAMLPSYARVSLLGQFALMDDGVASVLVVAVARKRHRPAFTTLALVWGGPALLLLQPPPGDRDRCVVLLPDDDAEPVVGECYRPHVAVQHDAATVLVGASNLMERDTLQPEAVLYRGPGGPRGAVVACRGGTDHHRWRRPPLVERPKRAAPLGPPAKRPRFSFVVVAP